MGSLSVQLIRGTVPTCDADPYCRGFDLVDPSMYLPCNQHLPLCANSLSRVGGNALALLR